MKSVVVWFLVALVSPALASAKSNQSKPKYETVKIREEAPGEPKSVELGLFSPKIQLQNPSDDIRIFRLGLVWTVNHNVRYFDWNIFAAKTTGNFKGASLGNFYDVIEGSATGARIGLGLNIVKQRFTGAQLGLINSTGEGFSGFQFAALNKNEGNNIGASVAFVNFDKNSKWARIAAVNFAESMEGGELGFVNISKKVNGFQVGLVNYSEDLNGIQVGLINIAMNSRLFPVLPIANFNFGF